MTTLICSNYDCNDLLTIINTYKDISPRGIFYYVDTVCDYCGNRSKYLVEPGVVIKSNRFCKRFLGEPNYESSHRGWWDDIGIDTKPTISRPSAPWRL